MEEYRALLSPSLPMAILLGVTALTGFFVLSAMGRVRNSAGIFVIGASWLRYVMSAFHEIVYRPLAAGMSGNAVASIGIFFVGLMNINWRHLALKLLVPFYVVIFIALASALANRSLDAGAITVLTKYGYLLVMTLGVFGAMQRSRNGDFMAALLWAFAPALIFQAASVVLRIGKATELTAGSVSYIGGYNHEAAFSVILITCLTVTCFAERVRPVVKNGLIIACVAGLVLANYRTALVAVAPLLLFYLGATSLQRFPFRDRPFVISALIVMGGVALGLASILFAERFQDVGIAASGDVNFFKPPEAYSVEESRLLSGRPRIWSMYIFGWLRGDLLQHIIGFGPESGSKAYVVYAHNTLIGALYEYGLVGLAGLLFLWLSMLAAALRVQHRQRGVLVGAHMTFLLLNMSTMPMWMIEGNILYGIICGYTLYLLSLQSRAQARVSQPQQQPPAPQLAG
ncbi:O-antigen ligase family protein [Terricaulis silvestris]|uniref:Lipid A core-O-antigen ligase n=1 Tax=Terricaulis silvestris TaxID=2686094 RepID=A0A6I6MM36_9CAUL|nr:O-antigen ligase family protein [Terricaulis silvestris]QGZ94044.1 Lipid A core - O-antigen ligase [Terricaulis silvestris]